MALKALRANLVAAVLPMLPRAAILEFGLGELAIRATSSLSMRTKIHTVLHCCSGLASRQESQC